MAEENHFQELIQRVRAGDQAAAQELVTRYESKIRRVVRVKLDTRLQRHFDSMDICQSVLASFFVRAALGQYEIKTPEDLLKLLSTMARNKLINAVNKQGRGRRDYHRVETGNVDHAGHEPTPSRAVSNRELLQETRKRLSEDERKLLDMREDGKEWVDIAAEVGGTAEALRKKLSRAIDRVAAELGLEE
jgi:RNA polymerase sigma-70 factor (ECF subfamily)